MQSFSMSASRRIRAHKYCARAGGQHRFASLPHAHSQLFPSLHIWRAADADFEVDGRRYGVFAHDWRVESG